MTSIRLTEALVDSLFTEEDAGDGRAILSSLPVRVLRAETGREFSAALVSVGSLNIEIEMDDAGRVNTWCTHDSRALCAHAAAALYALAESERPSGVGGVGRAPRAARQDEPWERALRGLLTPRTDLDDADPPGALALLFAVRPPGPGDPAGAGVAIRPAVRGSRGSAGSWVRSGIGWREIAASQNPDPRWRALADVVGLHEGRHNFAASGERIRARNGSFDPGWGLRDWIRLDATPSPGLWDALLAAHDAGVEFVADDARQTDVGVEQAVREAIVDLRYVGERLWVEAGLSDLGADAALLPIGAPTTAMAVLAGDRIDTILPLARPATSEWDALFVKGHLSIPATRIADFANDYLPGLREIAPLASSDGSFAVPAAPRPELVLVLSNAGPVARLYWEWEYPHGARRDRAAERSLIQDVERAAGRWAALLRRRRSDPIFPAIDLDGDQTVEFLAHVLPGLRDVEGLRIEAHDEVPALEFATEAPEIRFGVSPSGEDWFELDIVVTIQGEPVSSSELIRALSRGQTYFRLLSGTVFPLTDERFARLRDVLTEAKALRDEPSGNPSIPRTQFDLWYELAEIGILDAQHAAWLDSMRALGDDAAGLVAPPATFRATLRDYQHAGYSWLDFLRRNRLGGILADDMGLGKTVQILAALDRARIDEPDARFLVVTPTSVVGHWLSEAARFAPELATVGLTTTSAKRGSSVAEAAAGARLIVTSYAILRLDAEQFRALGVRVLVLDEAQNVKNSASKGYAAAKLIGSPTVFAVSGTPLENNLMELYALASLVAPGLLGTRESFREQFAKAISKDSNAHRLALLRKRIRPFLLRRTKEEVAPELPPKTVQVLEIPLHPTHLRAYERRFRREQQKLLGLLDDVKKNQIQILASLTRLRREALDPAFGDAAEVPGVSSAKLVALADLLDEITADGHRALVFSQFTDFLGRAAEVAEKKGLRFSYLDGSTTAAQRSRMVERFTNGEDPAFFISLKAGGTGLNLTAADYVILLDPWWNPAAEEQAIDRAHRIGQDKPVMVYRLISAGTIEQKVRELQEKKRRLFDDVLGGDVTSLLTSDDYRALVD
ncbi:DNA helicase [Microbacterium nanhaiense]|uniref:DNA helicase n=1 Tax=Microbacterium nanhaiense TaxID=1301026 RepID=A0ABQ2N3A4_9MICO|nr:DEAD/DEAH box helicase [Microbacterium nanhaiense]GGO65356.1 DNA helicase [Microbacterium nanhaiense]